MEKSKKINITTILVAIFIGIVAFFGLSVVAKNVTGSYETEEIVIASKKIPKGTKITKENVKEYFTIQKVPTNITTKENVKKLEDVEEKYVFDDIRASSPVYKDEFTTEEELVSFMNPDTASFAVSQFSDAASGTIRRSDHINIYAIDKDTGENKLVMENAYVEDAFDSSKVLIEPGDTEKAATSLNIIIEKSEEENFYTDIEDKDIKVTKVKE